MSPSIFLVLLLAAALHAGWNAIVKTCGDPLSTTVLVTACAAAIAGVALPWLPAPARAAWPFIGASAGLSIGYFALVARAYRTADMSRAYPLMRGAAPLLVALAEAMMGEPLPLLGWVGMAAICGGVLLMTLEGGRQRSLSDIGPALLNAGVIAAYTLVDGHGVRRSGAPAGYTLWIFLLTGTGLGGWALTTRRPAFLRHARRHLPAGLAAGAGVLASYGLALWAMTAAPVAMVAALRETSILFGTALAAALGEQVGRTRLLAAGAIAAGAMLLRLT